MSYPLLTPFSLWTADAKKVFAHLQLKGIIFKHKQPATELMPLSTNIGSNLEGCLSCSTSTALASVITAIATALLATVIFVLVQIAVCKCHPKFTPGGAETGTSAGGSMRRWMEVVEVWL